MTKNHDLISPTSPGDILVEEFMPEYGLKAPTLAKLLGTPRSTLNGLLSGGRCSAEMAVRLSLCSDTTPEFWANAQLARDLWDAKQEVDEGGITPVSNVA